MARLNIAKLKRIEDFETVSPFIWIDSAFLSEQRCLPLDLLKLICSFFLLIFSCKSWSSKLTVLYFESRFECILLLHSSAFFIPPTIVSSPPLACAFCSWWSRRRTAKCSRQWRPSDAKAFCKPGIMVINSRNMTEHIMTQRSNKSMNSDENN